LIDGLDRVANDNKQRVVNDILTNVRHYNDNLKVKGGHIDYRWRIVFTCRLLETKNVLIHLNTRKNLADGSLEEIEVSGLNQSEIDEVVLRLPKLTEIASAGHLKELLSRPLILDILTLPDIALPSASLPHLITETWLLDWFWQEIVCLAEKVRQGRGHPKDREQILLRLGYRSLQSGETVKQDSDSEALSGLISDRLIVDSGNDLRFGHDVLEDWTLAVIFRHHITYWVIPPKNR
jgi:hypothetical protein